jgi:hypothetical protein
MVMRTAISTVVLTAAIAGLAAPLQAGDGILIVQKTTTGTNTTTNQIQIERNRMRAETGGPGGRKQVVVFDGTAQVLRIIDDGAKSYSEMTKADAESLGAQMSGAMAQMQQQMANLPPEQRAQIEAMMKGRGMGAVPAKTEYVKIGTDTVGKWTCDKYDAMRNGAKTAEICTVDPRVLGFSAADFEITRQLADFFGKLVPQQADQLFKLGTGANEDKGFSGFPVRMVSPGAQPTVTELTEVSRVNFSDAMFAPPAGYKKEAFTGRGRGRQ